MNIGTIRMKRLSENAKLPKAGSAKSAGYDLYAALDHPVDIAPGETVKVGTGWAIALPDGCFGAIFARSGLSLKQGLAPANKVGVCDSDYRGEYIVALYNHSNETRTVNNGDRIAQLIIMPYASGDFVEVDEIGDTDRGDGGFGSTGTR